MTRKPTTPTDDQPHLAPLKIEGQPYPDDTAMFADLKHDRKQVDDLARRLALAGVTENIKSVFDGALEATDGFFADVIAAQPHPFDPTTNPDDVDPPIDSAAWNRGGQRLSSYAYAIRQEDKEKWDGIEAAMNSDDSTTSPYLLESSTVLNTLADEANRATAVIHQLDAEMAHLTQDADFQIARIQARRDAELESRRARVDDLMKIVSANTIVNGDKQESDQ